MSENNPYVFISYTSKDYEVAENIKKLLIESGFSVWIAPESLPYHGCEYMPVIDDAVEECGAFVLVLSNNTENSKYCPKEVQLAIDYRKGIIPYQITEVLNKENLKSRYNANLIDLDYLFAYKDEDAMSSLVNSLNKMLDIEEGDRVALVVISEAKRRPGYSRTTPLIHKQQENHPFFENTRDIEIEEIENAFKSSRFVALHGLSGSGKTELAKGYAKAMLEKGRYDKTTFVTYIDNIENTIASIPFDGFQVESNISKSNVVGKKLSLLAEEDERTLIILDNCNDRIPNIKELLDGGSYHVLMTSQISNQPVKNYPVGRLKDHDREVELFLKNKYSDYYDLDQTNLLDQIDEEEYHYIEEIIDLVEGHPLALELIAKSMELSLIDYPDYIDQLHQIGFQVETDDEIDYIKGGNSFEGNIRDLIIALFDQNDFDEEELKVLRYLSLLPVDGIAEKNFRELANLEDGKLLNKLVKRSWVKKEIRQETKQKMKRLPHIRVHPLVQKVLYQQLKPNIVNSREFFEKAAEFGMSYLEQKLPYLKREIITQLIDNMSETITEITEENDTIIENFVNVLYQSNYFKNSTRLLNLLEEARKKRYEENPSLENLYDLNTVYILQARIKYLNDEGKEALEIFDKVSFNDIDLKQEKYIFQGIDYMSYRGWALYMAQRFEEANELYADELSFFKPLTAIKNTKEFELKYANFLYNYGVSLYCVRKLEESKLMLENALEIYDKYYDKDHPERTSTLNQLGFIEIAKGRLPNAYSFFKEVLDIRSNSLGEEHVLTATAYDNMTTVYLKMFDTTRMIDHLENADSMNEKVLKTRSRAFPGKVTYADALLNRIRIDLRKIKYDLGDSGELLRAARENLAIAKEIYESKKLHLENYYEVEGDFYSAEDNMRKAIDSYEKAILVREKIKKDSKEEIKVLENKIYHLNLESENDDE